MKIRTDYKESVNLIWETREKVKFSLEVGTLRLSITCIYISATVTYVGYELESAVMNGRTGKYLS